MAKEIKLSPKHGVNPTIPICFWCGKEKNEVALLGKIGKRGQDIEAPRACILDYEPCKECAENWAKGFTLIEVTNQENGEGQPPMRSGNQMFYPTGRYAVVSGESETRFRKDYPDTDKLLVPTGIFQKMVGGEN